MYKGMTSKHLWTCPERKMMILPTFAISDKEIRACFLGFFFLFFTQQHNIFLLNPYLPISEIVHISRGDKLKKTLYLIPLALDRRTFTDNTRLT